MEKVCPLCKKGELEMIGVDDKKLYKMYCPSCHEITLAKDYVVKK
ncbi:MAG: hypothetical protein U9Q21_04690 [Candidatus Auribacterota bacterium]|nr:hypothetical protein [Candidatus Auribacterota bacterium]